MKIQNSIQGNSFSHLISSQFSRGPPKNNPEFLTQYREVEILFKNIYAKCSVGSEFRFF